MRELVADLRERLAAARLGGSESAREKHTARGKLLVRDRVDRLLDPGSPFLELSPLAATGMYGDDGQCPSAGIVTGIGRISGREAVVVANDATVKGGTYYPITVKKHLRAQAVAAENRLPCVYLVDSGGAFLPMQDEVFPDREHFGRIFFNQANLSAQRIPQIASVMGSCTAGGAYVPAMSDETVIVAQPGHDLPRRPAAGEGRDRRGRHRRGARRRRRARAHLRRGRPPRRRRRARAGDRPLDRRHAARGAAQPRRRTPVEEPPEDPAGLYDVVPADTRTPYDVREVIRRVVDGSRFHEFKQLYAETLVCGFARIWGYEVGIVANNGILFSESALKGAHFIELCNQRRIPLVFLQNITGFMVGREYENKGIARDGAKLVTAVACSRGAEVHRRHRRLVRRRQLRHVRPRLRPAVPLDVAQRADLGDGRRAGGGRARRGAPARRPGAGRGLQGPASASSTRRQGSPYYSTARLWDDGVIDPVDTRRVLGMGLAAAAHAPIAAPSYGVFRM